MWSQKICKNFQNKNWKSSTWKDLLRKINKTGDQEICYAILEVADQKTYMYLIIHLYCKRLYSELWQWWHLCKPARNGVYDWYFTLICSLHSKKWYWLTVFKSKRVQLLQTTTKQETEMLLKFVANVHAYESSKNLV